VRYLESAKVASVSYDEIDIVVDQALKDYDAGRSLASDPATDKALSTLDPRIRDSAQREIKELRDMGIDERVGRARVTTEQQAQQKAEHEAQFGAGGYAATPGHSLHERGLAIDVKLYDEQGRLITSWDHPWYGIVGDIGQSNGLQWGVTRDGQWGDLRHLQLPYNQLQ
jgi:hypothetical protein